MRSPSASGTFGRWAPLIGYLTLTFYLSSLSHVQGADRVPDYCLHIPEFVVLTLLLVRALSGSMLGPHAPRVLAASLAGGLVYGIFDELHQSFVPGRDSSVKDAAVDASATAATVIVLVLIGRRRLRRRTAPPGGDRRPRLQDAEEGGPASAASITHGRADSRTPRVELMTRQGCHLCEEGERVLSRMLGVEGTAWRRVDVDTDPALRDAYGLEVPVVLIDGIKRFKGRIDAARLSKLLREHDRLRRRSAKTMGRAGEPCAPHTSGST